MDLIFADHMKRIIAENEPALVGVHDKSFASRLSYHNRDVDEEVRLIKAIRRHMGRILRSIDADDFNRKGIHSVDGPLTLADILKSPRLITFHITRNTSKRNASRSASASALSHSTWRVSEWSAQFHRAFCGSACMFAIRAQRICSRRYRVTWTRPCKTGLFQCWSRRELHRFGSLLCSIDLHASKLRVTSALNQEVTGVVY